MARYDFASDNTAGAAPEAMDALVRANAGFTSGYGSDEVTARAADRVRAFLDADAEVRFLASGTAANALSLAALCQPFEAVLAHADAHAATHETGAPAFFGHGLGVIGLPGASGQIDPAAMARVLDEPEVSYIQAPAALSLTNATEFGTIYEAAEIAALTAAAKAKGLGVHLDGARLANAVAAGFDPKALKSLNIDMLVIGGTKAGMPPTEALVVFDKALAGRLDARLKQGGQLPSKGRFFAAPFIGMLESGAFVERARHANAMAKKLAGLMPFKVAHPVQSNAVFVDMDEGRLEALTAAGWSVHRFTDGTVRFMCSWATTPESVEALGEALKAVA